MAGDLAPRDQSRIWTFLLKVVADDRERCIRIRGYRCADSRACEMSFSRFQDKSITDYHVRHQDHSI